MRHYQSFGGPEEIRTPDHPKANRLALTLKITQGRRIIVFCIEDHSATSALKLLNVALYYILTTCLAIENVIQTR